MSLAAKGRASLNNTFGVTVMLAPWVNNIVIKEPEIVADDIFVTIGNKEFFQQENFFNKALRPLLR